MKTLYIKILLCLLVAFANINPISASHVVGSEITWRCIPNSNGNFEVTLVIYRDCQAVTLCSNSCGAACNYSVQISGADTGYNGVSYGSASLSLVSIRDVNPNPRCSTSKSICVNMGCVTPGTFTPGVERYEFRGIVNLGATSGIPTAVCNVRLSYSLCCRNGAISTGAANANFYIEAFINRCKSTNPCNSSPYFSQDPPHVICSGLPFVYNTGAIDPDLDSLSYSFTPSMQSMGTSVNYITPYTFNKPMPWSGLDTAAFPNGISCNPINGDISFTPNAGNNFVGIVAIAIQQWRKHPITGVYEWMGSIKRDMQMWIRTCDPNNPPTITTIPYLNGNPNNPKKNWEVEAGQTLCFDVVAKDTNLNDTTYLSWNQPLTGLGATFTPNYVDSLRRTQGPRLDSYKFCWTPSQQMASNNPYYFNARAVDNRCPLPGYIATSFSIKVNAFNASILPIANDTVCRGVHLYASQGNKFQWLKNGLPLVGDTLNHLYTETSGNYQVIIRSAGLVTDTSEQLRITVIPKMNATVTFLTDSIVCNGDTTKIQGIQGNGYQYKWYRNGTLTSSNQIFHTMISGSYHYTVTHPLGCVDTSRNFGILIIPLPYASITAIGNTSLCQGDSVRLITSLLPADTGKTFTYQWYKNNSILLNQTLIDLNTKDSGTYKVLVTDKRGCYQFSNSIIVQNLPPIFASLSATGPTTFCDGNGVVLQPNPHSGFDYHWLKDGVKFLQNNSPYTASASGTFRVVILGNSCSDTSNTIQVTMHPKPAAAISTSGNTDLCSGQQALINLSPVTGSNYLWLKDNTALNQANDTIYIANTSGQYSAIVVDQNNCRDTSNKIVITLHPNPTAIITASGNTHLCDSEQVQLRLSPVIGANYFWLKNNVLLNQENDTVYIAGTAGQYRAIVIDQNSCRDTSNQIQVHVNPKPIIGPLSGQAINLIDSTTYIYSVSTQINHTYHWIVDNGTILFGQQNDAVGVQWNQGSCKLTAIISNAGGCKDTAILQLAVGPNPVPTIISFNPTTATDGISVTIDGTFLSNATVVRFGGVDAKSFMINSPNEIIAVVDTGATGDVMVTTPAGTAILAGFTYTSSTGLSDLNTQSYRIYPNPTTDKLYIQSDKSLLDAQIELLDISGRLVDTETYVTENKIVMNLQTLQSGIYLLRIQHHDMNNLVKVLKY